MGYLGKDGNTLNFEQSKPYHQQIKRDGVTQFLYLLKNYKGFSMEENFHNKCPSGVLPIYWGDEIEGHVVYLNEIKRVPQITVDLHNFFEKIQEEQKSDPNEIPFIVMPEYGGWMIETTPSDPYFTINNLEAVIINLKERQKVISKHFPENQKVLFTSTFPLLGNPDRQYFTLSDENSNNVFVNNITQSLFIDDRIINTHPRFPTLSQNIRQRRQKKVDVNIPLFMDKNTSLQATMYDPVPGYIHIDAMAFGMGSSCIQTTFSAKNLSHSRRLYDQLAIMSPLFLALTASSPIFRGRLSAVDTRWDIIAGSVDCRTEKEQDPNSENYIPKSRFSSISYFISEESRNLPEYNDIKFPLNQEIMEFAIEESKKIGVEIDEKLVKHLGFLFIRDPLVLFERKLKVDNEKETIHFENIQSTNWNSVRFKPPPAMDSSIGWRVEFRTMETQLTSDMNAAFMLLTHILVRLFYQSDDLNFYIPISKVDENFVRAKQVEAVTTQKFFFRTNIFDSGLPNIEELTLQEIFFGKPNVFQGLQKVASDIWDEMMNKLFGSSDKTTFDNVWKFIHKRTSGECLTSASWIRKYVQNHPLYKHDSVISNELAFDLITALTSISEGTLKDPNFQQIF